MSATALGRIPFATLVAWYHDGRIDGHTYHAELMRRRRVYLHAMARAAAALN